MEITSEQIRQLRIRTGAGIMDCKKALIAADGDEEKAIKNLREQGVIKAAKKADRAAGEGVIGVYLHSNKKVAGLVSVRCETDFVARNPSYQEFAKDLAMHVVAMDPLAVSTDELSPELVGQEREVVEKEVAELGKSPEVAAGIIKGKIEKFKAERSLLTQPFVKDQTITVGDLVTQKIAELGENIVVERFVRMEI